MIYAGELSVFIIITGVIFGFISVLTARNLALNWKPYWHLFPFILLNGGANRFIHFALFGDEILSLSLFISQTFILMLIHFLAFRYYFVKKRIQQYPWIYSRSFIFFLKRKE